MTSLPRISIVTLSFNQGRYLAEAIESIIGQGYPNLDYIVVDPGSKDDSRAIIARYADRIQTVILDPDNGPADGLNKGFAAATGEIFGYINADDLMLPGSLAAIASHFAGAPDLDMILGRGLLLDGEGRVKRRIQSSRIDLKALAHGAMTFVQQGHYFRRGAFARAGGFNIENRTCWDGELLVDMVLAGARSRSVPDRLGAFRLYGESITGSGRFAEQMKRDLDRLAHKVLGRPLGPEDVWTSRWYLLRRRLAHPLATLDGLRARLTG